MEPVESLRYVAYLSPAATVVTAVDPFVNIPDYPPTEEVARPACARLPRAVLVEAERLAREAGDVLSREHRDGRRRRAPAAAAAASRSSGAIRQTFGRKGERALAGQPRRLRGGLEGRGVSLDRPRIESLLAATPATATRAC